MTVPVIDFVSIRKQLGVGSGDLIAEIESWSDIKQKKAWDLIEKYEEDVRDKVEIQYGCKGALLKFRKAGLKLGVLTRNSRKSVDSFLKIFDLDFDAILTREHPHVKPSPQPVYDILKQWDLVPEDVLVVGDFIHDIECGNSAGTDTCFYANPGQESYAEFADFSVNSYQELEQLVLTQTER